MATCVELQAALDVKNAERTVQAAVVTVVEGELETEKAKLSCIDMDIQDIMMQMQIQEC